MTVNRSQTIGDYRGVECGYNLILRCYQVGIFPSFPLTIGVVVNGFLPVTTAIFTATGRERGIK